MKRFCISGHLRKPSFSSYGCPKRVSSLAMFDVRWDVRPLQSWSLQCEKRLLCRWSCCRLCSSLWSWDFWPTCTAAKVRFLFPQQQRSGKMRKLGISGEMLGIILSRLRNTTFAEQSSCNFMWLISGLRALSQSSSNLKIWSDLQWPQRPLAHCW